MRSQPLQLLLVLALVACGGTPPSEEEDSKDPVIVSAAVDRAVATIGDAIQLTISVSHEAGYELEFPEQVEVVGAVQLKEEIREPQGLRDGRLEERWTLSFTATDTGSVLIEAVDIQYRVEGEEEWRSASTGRLFVEVQSVISSEDDLADIRDIKPALPLPEPRPWWWIALPLGAFLATLLGGWLWWRRKKKILENEKQTPPWEIAIRELDQLHQMPVESWPAVHDYYYRLSEVVRVWVEARFALNATDLTSAEIIRELPRLRDLGDEPRRSFRGFLEVSDQVKYAAALPDSTAIEGHWQQARSFVEETRPLEQDSNEESP